MTKLSISHTLPVDAATYWRINNDVEFERFQSSRLGLLKYEEVERRVQGDILHRRIRVEPDIAMPGPLQKLIQKSMGGSSFYYEETRDIPLNFALPRMAYSWQIIPAALRDKIHIGGKFIVEAIDAQSCRRILDGEIEVGIFGLGGMIEKFAVSEIEKSYQKIPAVVAEWLRQQRV